MRDLKLLTIFYYLLILGYSEPKQGSIEIVQHKYEPLHNHEA